MKKSLILTAAIALSFGAVANATGPSNTGSLQLTGEVDGSIAMAITANVDTGIVLVGGSGTSAATATIAPVSYYGTADNAVVSGFTKTSDSTHIILTGGFAIQVDKANLTSSNYALTASVTTSDGNAWKLDTVTLGSSASTALLGGTSSYATPVAQTLVLTVPTSAAAGSSAISGTINLTATAN
ncbi:MAG TPA: hypothetical protein VG096_02835 [Bryobacteraceae bacterium]|jgi:hypothetical protein|nr:hypothetical protein [Bryobacteraceae bacterium]